MAAIPDSWQYVQPENWAKSGEAHSRAVDTIFAIQDAWYEGQIDGWQKKFKLKIDPNCLGFKT